LLGDTNLDGTVDEKEIQKEIQEEIQTPNFFGLTA
jgi:hypothetical protein